MATGDSLRLKSNLETSSLENAATKLHSSSSLQGTGGAGGKLLVTVDGETEQLAMSAMF